jgi:hypothetical protein
MFLQGRAGMRVASSAGMSKRTKSHDGGLGVAAPQTVGGMTATHPDPERIAQRAYELYCARGRVDGQAEDDWLRAERELTNGRSSER